MKRKITVLLLAALTISAVTGCGGGEKADNSATVTENEIAASKVSTEEADLKEWEQVLAEDYELTGDDEQTWGFVSIGFTDTFGQSYTASLEAYVEQAFPNVTLNIGDGELDVNTQIELSENFITQGVDVLLISASDSDGCVAICDMAKEAGIPFVVINSDVNCEEVDHFFIGSDHYYSGQLQAEYLIDNVDDTETLNLCYLGGTDGYTHSKLRREGVYETLDAAGYNYTILSDQEGEYLRDKALQITEDWVIQYGEDIDIIVAANDEMAMGALQAVQAADLKDVVICGIDANQDALQEVLDGDMGCTVFQDAASQGKWGAIAAYAAGQGKEPEFLDVPYIQVTADTAEEYLN